MLRQVLLNKKEKPMVTESVNDDFRNMEKEYTFDPEVIDNIINNNKNPFVDNSNIIKDVHNINCLYNDINKCNSFIHDAVDKYENNPENINEIDVKKLEDNINHASNTNKKITLAVLSKEDASNIENFKNNVNDTLTKTAIGLDQNIHLCTSAFKKIKDVFDKTDFEEYIHKLLRLREDVFDKDIKYITCIDHLIEAIADKIKPDSDLEKEIFEILDHHSYLFGQLLGPSISGKKAYLINSKLPESKLKDLCKYFKEYITLSKSYKNSKIFSFSDTKDYVVVYNSIFSNIEKYTNSIKLILDNVNSIGEISLFRSLSSEEKMEKSDELVNNTIVKFLSNFVMMPDYKISKEIEEDTKLTSLYFNNGLVAIQDNKYKVITFDTAVGDNVVKLNNVIFNSVCDNLKTVKNLNKTIISGFLNNTLNYLKNNIPSTEESENLITVNAVIKILTELLNIYKEDMIYKLICIPNMLYNHAIIYKKLVECLEDINIKSEGKEDEDTETDDKKDDMGTEE